MSFYCFHVKSRCKCGQCKTELLEGALEFRCCHEVAEAIGKLAFDGSLERIRCLTHAEDFKAMTNSTVLLNVGPMLRDQNGRNYRKPPGAVQNNAMNE